MNHSSNDHQHHPHHPPLPTQPAPVADIGSNLIVNPSVSTPQEAQQQQHVGMSMAMTFHFGIDETILFSFWDTNSELWLFLVSWIIIFVISFLYEGLKFSREKLYKDSIRRASGASSTDRESDSSGGRIPVISASGDGDRESDEGLPIRIYLFTSTHFLQTFLHMIQIILSYTLMLIFMTYNVWLCAAVILGAGAGYLLFGWKRAIVGFDVTEHCQ